MNYLSFFSLEREPFSNAQGTRFYYNSAQHARVVVRMMFAIENMKGLAVVTGPIGTGKSTTARRLLEGLPKERFEAALLTMVQSGVSPLWLLTKVAYLLGVGQPAEDRTRILGQLYRRLHTLHNQGKKAVILIDEAQLLESKALMEVLRGLLSLELPEKKLLTICLFGLPDLEGHLRQDLSLFQRIAVRGRLVPLDREEAEAYVKHRLKLAGADHMLFTSEAVEAVFQASGGVPRLINTLCDNALFEGFLSRADPITRRILTVIATEMGYAEGINKSRNELPGLAQSPRELADLEPEVEELSQKGSTRTSRARLARGAARRRVSAAMDEAAFDDVLRWEAESAAEDSREQGPVRQRFEVRRGLPKKRGAVTMQRAAAIAPQRSKVTTQNANDIDLSSSEAMELPSAQPSSQTPLPSDPPPTSPKVSVTVEPPVPEEMPEEPARKAPQKAAEPEDHLETGTTETKAPEEDILEIAPPKGVSPEPTVSSWIDDFDPASLGATVVTKPELGSIDSLLSNLSFDPDDETIKEAPDLGGPEFQETAPQGATASSSWASRLLSWGKGR